jgi:integrase
MPTLTQSPPAYRLHKPSGRAVVTLDGRDFYLGPHGSAESHLEYDRLVAAWLANGRRLPGPGEEQLTVHELILEYWKYAKRYYVKHGQPTHEQAGLKLAFRPLARLYGPTPLAAFGPCALKAVREAMIAEGWCRGNVNRNIGRVKRLFFWGVENELVPAEVGHALRVVKGLRKGRVDFHGARESSPVRPVAESHVEGVRPHVSRQVWAIIQIQLFTGCRPGEAVIMRGCDLDMSGPVWMYRPSEHKMEHYERDRVIAIGPQAQAVIKPFLKKDLGAFLFSAAEAEEERNAERRANRVTPMTPSQRRRRRKGDREHPPKDRYTVNSYRRAIDRGCELAFAPPADLKGEEKVAWSKAHKWNPHQLRHTAATRIRREFGIDVARAVLGHSSATVTGLYAELDRAKASDVMARIG